MIIKKPIFIMGMIILSSGFLVSDAYAYLDPASGSLIIQMVVGALVGTGIAVKVYWYKIKEKIFSKR